VITNDVSDDRFIGKKVIAEFDSEIKGVSRDEAKWNVCNLSPCCVFILETETAAKSKV
jgi:hypothetical protein